MEYEYTDRYKELGMPYPNVETMCKGQCEGTGVYPEELENGEWEFVTCPDCNGTGKK
jgi:DnaJ-class molecular chaperone